MTPSERVAAFLDARLAGPVHPTRPGLVAEIALGNPLPADRLRKCIRLTWREMGRTVDERYLYAEYEKRKAANGPTQN